MRISRYVLIEVLGPFLGGLIFFLFVFLMFQALRLADFFILHGVSLITLGKMTSLMAISFLPTALPVAFLIAVLIGFSRLSSDSELIAMKASGVSLSYLSRPIFGFAAVIVVLSIALNTNWVPWSEKLFKTTLIKVSNTKVVTSIREGTFNSGFFDLLIFADKVDPETSRLKHVFIYDEREAKNPFTVVADEGEIIPVKTESELGAAAVLKLYDGSIHRSDEQEHTYQKIDFGEYRLYLKIDEGADTATLKPHMIPDRDLKEMIRTSTMQTYEGREFRGEYWRRYATALAPFAFVWLGIGFGTIRTRSARASSTLTALLIAVGYWGLQSFGTFTLLNGFLSPFFSMQLANIAALVIGFPAFRRATW